MSISISSVKTTLGESRNNLSVLCTSPSINKWSRCKPVKKAGISISFNSDPTRADGYVWGLKPLKSSDGKVYMNNYIYNLLSGGIADQAKKDWPYVLPTGGESSPYRLGDFRGYNHSANVPFTMAIRNKPANNEFFVLEFSKISFVLYRELNADIPISVLFESLSRHRLVVEIYSTADSTPYYQQTAPIAKFISTKTLANIGEATEDSIDVDTRQLLKDYTALGGGSPFTVLMGLQEINSSGSVVANTTITAPFTGKGALPASNQFIHQGLKIVTQLPSNYIYMKSVSRTTGNVSSWSPYLTDFTDNYSTGIKSLFVKCTIKRGEEDIYIYVKKGATTQTNRIMLKFFLNGGTSVRGDGSGTQLFQLDSSGTAITAVSSNVIKVPKRVNNGETFEFFIGDNKAFYSYGTFTGIIIQSSFDETSWSNATSDSCNVIFRNA